MQEFTKILERFFVNFKKEENRIEIKNPNGVDVFIENKDSIEYINTGDTTNIYFNDKIENIKDSYVFFNLADALSYLRYNNTIQTQGAIIIINKYDRTEFFNKILSLLQTLDNIYFCVSNTKEQKLFFSIIYMLINGVKEINVNKYNDDYIVIYDTKIKKIRNDMFVGKRRYEDLLNNLDIINKFDVKIILHTRCFKYWSELWNIKDKTHEEIPDNTYFSFNSSSL